MPWVVWGQTRSESDYFGCVAFQRDNRISIFTMDPGTGKLTWQQQVAVDGGPGALAIDLGPPMIPNTAYNANYIIV